MMKVRRPYIKVVLAFAPGQPLSAPPIRANLPLCAPLKEMITLQPYADRDGPFAVNRRPCSPWGAQTGQFLP